jgi:hypothetical protein
MPNQRAKNMKRTTITVERASHAWAVAEGQARGINDFSTFVRVLIAAEKKRMERGTKNEKKDRS